jgi:5'-methylthioadenosine phosphorylase
MVVNSSRAEIGVIGGSGFYDFLEAAESVSVETPYGPPSDALTLAEVGGRRVAFLPRHGAGHTLPPHKINYRANLWAMQSLGVSRVIGPCAVGSLRRELRPGDVVIADQLVDRTSGRPDTYHDGPVVAHLSAADPYCPELSRLAVRAVEDSGMTAHSGGTVVVIQGPRFSTRAEGRWFASCGWDVVGMTQYPEVVLARELGLCYLNLSLVTDYDSGLADDPDRAPVTVQEVLDVFSRNMEKLRRALLLVIDRAPADRSCGCAELPATIA